uniref:EGF-like domain-containing protein n=1 Tax=Macrostomum lignano TaxID=282301 RepID=A0A1I8J0B6_9PLAT
NSKRPLSAARVILGGLISLGEREVLATGRKVRAGAAELIQACHGRFTIHVKVDDFDPNRRLGLHGHIRCTHFLGNCRDSMETSETSKQLRLNPTACPELRRQHQGRQPQVAQHSGRASTRRPPAPGGASTRGASTRGPPAHQGRPAPGAPAPGAPAQVAQHRGRRTRGAITRGASTQGASTRAPAPGCASTRGASTRGAASAGAAPDRAPAPGRQHRGRQHNSGRQPPGGAATRGASTRGASTRGASHQGRQHQGRQPGPPAPGRRTRGASTRGAAPGAPAPGRQHQGRQHQGRQHQRAPASLAAYTGTIRGLFRKFLLNRLYQVLPWQAMTIHLDITPASPAGGKLCLPSPTCETKLSACDSPDTPCRNNGTCIPGTGAGGCSCTPGFNGTFCESDIDEVRGRRAQFCQHASACLNQFGTYSCHCLAGWTGKNCTEDVDECKLTNACFNGGTCVNSASR